MKKTLIKSIIPILKDRAMLSSIIAVFVAGILFFAYMLANIEPVDRLIYSRYTFFGQEHFYKDVWQYRIVLAFFGLIVSFAHSVLIIKLNKTAGRRVALFFAIMSILLLIFGAITIGISIREIPN